MARTGLHIMLSAGENSGDLLGAGLMQALRQTRSDIRISGLGGPKMQAQGLESVFPMDDIAVLGIGEVLFNLRRIFRRIRQMVDFVLQENPDVLVLIDSQEFSFHVAKRVKKQRPDMVIIGYVAPTVWGWRPKRAKKMRPYFNHVMAVLSFEPRVFVELDGPACSYVGHPSVERMNLAITPQEFRRKFSIGENERIISLLPGSRMSELRHMLVPFYETAKKLNVEHDNLRFVIPTVPHLRRFIHEAVADWDFTPILIESEEDKQGLFRAGHAALVASGTATLELGLGGQPMIVAQRADVIAQFVIDYIIRPKTFVLPNLILDRLAVPEFTGARCTADLITPALKSLIENDNNIYDTQKAALDQMRDIMQSTGSVPSQCAAEKVLALADKA